MAQVGPQAILQRYTLLRKIATGGMAEVYLGEQTGAGGFKKRVAIKRILPAFAEDEKFVEMFLDEARLAAMFHHPNLIQIYELGEIDGLLTMVMEYVRGLSLSELLKRAHATGAPPVPFGVAARLVAQAAEGLHYAHEFQDPDTGEPLGLVHRDISPQNILLGKEGIVKVMDFGIAKAAGQMHHTSTGTLKGKLAYMPPEQLNGKPLDRRADIWALGVVLYELLAGRRPFVGESEASVFRGILQEEAPPIEELRRDVPEPLRAVLRSLLAREREERTPTAGDLSKELEAYLQSGPRTTAAEVGEWVKPLLPAPGEAAPGQAMLTPSNVSRSTTGAKPPPLREVSRSQVNPAEAATRARPAPEDRSLQLPPVPQPRRAWPIWVGAFLGTLAVGGSGVAIWKLQGSPPVEEVAAPAPATRPLPVATAPKPPPEPLPPPPAHLVPPPVAAPTPAPKAFAVAPKPQQKRVRPPPRAFRQPASRAPVRTVVIAEDQTPGSLLVNTEPWSRVTIDGKDMGQTPLANIKLSAGNHLLVCTNPDMGLTHRETVNIPAGGKVKRLIQLGGGE